MKSIVFRALTSMVVGVLLMVYPEKVTDWLVIVVGCLFLIPGMFSIVSYFSQKKDEGVHIGLPIAGLGSAMLGIWMILDSAFFIKAFMYAVAVVLILVALNRISGNVSARKVTSVPFLFYLFPVLLILVSVYVLAHPIEVASIPFYILGVSMIAYGVLELCNTLWLRGKVKKYEQEHQTNQTEVGPALTSEDDDITDAEIVE